MKNASRYTEVLRYLFNPYPANVETMLNFFVQQRKAVLCWYPCYVCVSLMYGRDSTKTNQYLCNVRVFAEDRRIEALSLAVGPLYKETN
jgi:hypothetical protein